MRLPSPPCRPVAAGLAALALAAAAPAAGQIPVVVDPGQGLVPLSTGGTGAAELSGITWTGGTSYLAVGDDGAKSLWQLAIGVDAATGFIDAAAVVGGVAAAGLGADAEGIAYRATTGSVFVADEQASTITQFDAFNGGVLGSVAVPAIYAPANVQANLGLESLAYGGGGLWTANEEALASDGPLSTTAAGSWVRIQRFDEALAAAGQWAYRTDPISAIDPLFGVGRSGVVEIVPWSATTVLVLERELGGLGVPTFRSRLYGAELGGASDVSALGSLASGGFTPLAKTLLWQGSFVASNFEGMTLGPVLADGSRSLLLVSDDGGGLTRSLYALSVVPEPASVVLAIAAGAAAVPLVRARRRAAHRWKA